jgi:hypothetical protein
VAFAHRKVRPVVAAQRPVHSRRVRGVIVASIAGQQRLGPSLSQPPSQVPRGPTLVRHCPLHQQATVMAAISVKDDSFKIPASPDLVPEGPWKKVEGGVCAAKGFKATGGCAVWPLLPAASSSGRLLRDHRTQRLQHVQSAIGPDAHLPTPPAQAPTPACAPAASRPTCRWWWQTRTPLRPVCSPRTSCAPRP